MRRPVASWHPRQRRRGATEAGRRAIKPPRCRFPSSRSLHASHDRLVRARSVVRSPEIPRLPYGLHGDDYLGGSVGVDVVPVGEKDTARAPYTQERREVECR